MENNLTVITNGDNMIGETTRDVPPTFPFEFDGLNPPTEYARYRSQCPLGTVRLASGHNAKLVVKYEDAAQALSDQRLSHDLRSAGSPRFTLGPSHYDEPSLLNMEGEAHQRIRRIIAPAFTPRRIARWEPTIDQIANDLLGQIAESSSRADFVTAFAQQFPSRVLCQILGIPDTDSTRFVRWSNAFVSSVPLDGEQRLALISEFSDYIAGLIAQRRIDPSDSLVDDLINAQEEGDYLADAELIGLIISLIAAGTDTTANALARMLLTLLDNNRAAWIELCDQPDLIPSATNELLRLLVMGQSAALRMATADVELPSGSVSAGEAVVIATSAAMRDEHVFDAPDSVQFERPVQPLLVFGKGAHVCLGMNLAKAEVRIALHQLVKRFPNLRLEIDPVDLQFAKGEVLHSITSLPVTWT